MRVPRSSSSKAAAFGMAVPIFRDKAFNGQALATRSSDGGQSFAELRPITSSNES